MFFETWDEAERLVARRRRALSAAVRPAMAGDGSTHEFRRLAVWLQFLPLGAIAGAMAFAIGLGLPGLLRRSLVALAILVGPFVIADVVAREAAAIGPRGARPVGQAPPATEVGFAPALEPVEQEVPAG